MSPTSGEATGAIEATAEPAVEGEKNPPNEEEKHPAEEEEDKKAVDGVGTFINPNGKDVKEQVSPTTLRPKHVVGAEKNQVPTSKDGSAMINKQQTHLLSVPEEKDVSEKLQVKKRKEKKMKRSELMQMKTERRSGGTEKKMSELMKIKTERQSGGTEKKMSEPMQIKTERQSGGTEKKMSELMQINTEGQLGGTEKNMCELMQIRTDGRLDGTEKRRTELVQTKIEGQLDGIEKIHAPVETEDPSSETCCSERWHATYSIALRIRHKRSYKGSIQVLEEMNRIILHDADGLMIDHCRLKKGETIYPRVAFDMPCHKVEIGELIVQSKEDPPLPTISATRQKKDKRDEKDMKRKRPDENCKRRDKLKRNKIMTSPQAKLVGSSIGRFARVASLSKGMSPQAQHRKSESPTVPNVSVHFPSPNVPRVEAKSTRFQPRKLKSKVWKEFIPIYEDGKLVEGQCKHCNEVFPASKATGTNHIHRHLKKCLTRSSMHEIVAKMRASTSSPQVSSLENWNFNQKESRRALSNMIVQHGLPFSIVEYSGFIKFVKCLNPMFKMISRTTIKEDCLDSYKEEKSLLREMLKNCGARVSLTADMWTSNQRLGYLCVTCHFIDGAWKMQKRTLRFCMMETPHNGFRMYNTMLKSLQYWNIEDKICSITLDNASVNGKMMEYLKENLMKKQMLKCGELFHIRCGAHVLNLIVQDGLLVMKGSIDNIRDSVKYVKSSQTREELFEDIVQQLGIISEKEPSLDVPTRWNSTYLMIDSALPYREAFQELVKQDMQYKYAPSADDWKMAEAIRSLLKLFFEATKVVSGSSYPTANCYFHEMWSVKLLLERQAKNKNKLIASMVSEMQKKFDKYWKESYLANCIPVVFDPRYKFEFVKFRIRQAFGDSAAKHLEKVEMTIISLFEDYSNDMEMRDSFANPSEEVDVDEVPEIDNQLADWEAHLRVQKKQATNELDRYLSEDLFPPEKDFDILGWWELHSPKYPILSRIARDVLAIQASSVASESSFSAGGRIISDQRNRLKSDTVEALVCLQDWLKAADTKQTKEYDEEEEYLVFYQGSECNEESAFRDSQTNCLREPKINNECEPRCAS